MLLSQGQRLKAMMILKFDWQALTKLKCLGNREHARQLGASQESVA